VLFGITVRLDFLRGTVETAAAEALGRPVRIDGSIELIPTLRPTLTVGDFAIGNPPGWEGPPLARVELARTQIDLPDLLDRAVTIGEITAEGVDLHLVSLDGDRNNWRIEEGPSPEPPAGANAPPPEAEGKASEAEGRIRFKALDSISLDRVAVTYRDEVLDETVDFRLDAFSGSAGQGEPIVFTLEGSLQGRPYRFRVDGGSVDTLRDLRASAWPLKLSGEMADTAIEAEGQFGEADGEPFVRFGFALERVDLGALLASLRVAEGVAATTDRLGVEAHLRGSSLHELLDLSEAAVSLEGGRWMLVDRNTRAEVPVHIASGRLTVAPEKPVRLAIDGRIDRTPVGLAVEGMPIADLVKRPDAVRWRIAADAAGASLVLDGRLAMPVKSRDATLELTFEGESLDRLDDLFGVDLPPFGPFGLEARLSVVESGYELSDLRVRVGESELDGAMRLDTSGTKPRLDVNLTSRRLQIDDFSTEGWSPERAETVSGEGPDARGGPSRAPGRGRALLSKDVLDAFDAAVTVGVKEVLSGKDRLGAGRLVVSVEEGALAVEPLTLDLPGGSVLLGFSYRPGEADTTVHVRAEVDRFDVGIPARRARPDSKFSGLLSLDVAIAATAPDLARVMANSDGHFDLAFWPTDLDAGKIDLWAVNLLNVLSRQVDDEPRSRVNCLVARFDLDDGRMSEKAIFMDTTRMSVNAEAAIDFKNRTIDLAAAPKAKRPEFFSASTPVRVRGSFSDFAVGIKNLHVLRSVVSIITSPVHVPVRRLFSGRTPADGLEACRQAWSLELAEE
jgi:uncharacterized protein involved in outer membrane biogenesis